MLSGLILRRIFDRNQQEFTSADPKTIPTIAVIEEAQSVLNENASSSEPYIAWVKEGRKYDLGAVLITQQPGSIPTEILSQGDNWFIFHLLSAADLVGLKKANSHFSDDLLSSLLNEPIPGQGLFWSSVGGKPYPVSLQVLSFEKMYKMLDTGYSLPAASTYAIELRALFGGSGARTQSPVQVPKITVPDSPVAIDGGDTEGVDQPVDVLADMEQKAIDALGRNQDLMDKIRSDFGGAWGSVKAFLLTELPEHLDDRDTIAYHLVRKAMDKLIGVQNQAWESYRNPARGNKTYVRVKR